MRKTIYASLICIILAGQNPAFCAAKPSVQPTPTSPAVSPVQPTQIDFAVCNKIYNVDSQKLLYLTLSSINANRFNIQEIQSASGYAIFSVGQRQFLANIITINAQNSMLKITPCNNDYFFPVGIVQNMFKYIELNLSTPIEKITVN